jgi:hypothetical protein
MVPAMSSLWLECYRIRRMDLCVLPDWPHGLDHLGDRRSGPEILSNMKSEVGRGVNLPTRGFQQVSLPASAPSRRAWGYRAAEAYAGLITSAAGHFHWCAKFRCAPREIVRRAHTHPPVEWAEMQAEPWLLYGWMWRKVARRVKTKIVIDHSTPRG